MELKAEELLERCECVHVRTCVHMHVCEGGTLAHDVYLKIKI